MSDDKDKALVQQLIEGVFGRRGQSPIYQTAGRLIEELSEQFIVALATARGEEREAAFKVQCADCAEGSTPTFDQDARWYYHGLGHAEVGCSASKLRIAALEASANQKEGMNG